MDNVDASGKRKLEETDLQENAKKLKEDQTVGFAAKPVHPFFTRRTSDWDMKWLNRVPSLLIARSNTPDIGSKKIAAFDLDGTLILTKSGRVHPKDETDWRWWHSCVPETIRELHREGFKIVLFSNQNGLKTDARVKGFKQKVESIVRHLTVPVWVFAALHKDQYRKPMTGMWDWFSSEANEGVEIDKQQSFYVGDAAGRDAEWKLNARKDHSGVDRKFAANIGIQFYTPEEFFLKESKAPFTWGEFIPSEYPAKSLPLFTPTSSPLLPNDGKPEVIVFFGYPASGKSTFAKKYILPRGYVYVNQDTLKSREKCIKLCKSALAENKPVVVDNTNADAATRASYIKLAKEANVPVRCFHFTADEHLARHNNYYRALHAAKSNEDVKRELLGDVAFRTFKTRQQPPQLSEGFDEIKKINFVFEGSDEDLEAWRKWYH